MDKRHNISNKASILFKRWSRKNYASFCSLKREVTIGRLTANITERLLKKSSALHHVVSMLPQFVEEEKYGEICQDTNSKDSILEQLYALLLAPIMLSKTPSCGLNNIDLINTRKVILTQIKLEKASPFYFYKC